MRIVEILFELGMIYCYYLMVIIIIVFLGLLVLESYI